jgi:hypothetical protein
MPDYRKETPDYSKPVTEEKKPETPTSDFNPIVVFPEEPSVKPEEEKETKEEE